MNTKREISKQPRIILINCLLYQGHKLRSNFLKIFRRFPKTFIKILRILSEVVQTFPIILFILWKLPKIAEYEGRLLRKITRWFNLRPTPYSSHVLFCLFYKRHKLRSLKQFLKIFQLTQETRKYVCLFVFLKGATYKQVLWTMDNSLLILGWYFLTWGNIRSLR